MVADISINEKLKIIQIDLENQVEISHNEQDSPFIGKSFISPNDVFLVEFLGISKYHSTVSEHNYQADFLAIVRNGSELLPQTINIIANDIDEAKQMMIVRNKMVSGKLIYDAIQMMIEKINNNNSNNK